MRILFTGGGSGGHIFPIIAVKREIDSIIKEDYYKPLLFRFVGGGIIEKEALSKEGISRRKVIPAKWRRYLSFQNLIDVFKFPFSFIQAAIHVWTFMPDVIFSKGGPGSLPVVLMGWFYRIPIIAHESDSIPGFVNKSSFPLARKIAISFEEMKKFLSEKQKKKTILTGVPLRQKVLTGSKEEAKDLFNLTGERKVILIIGGSQGAEEINSVFIDAIYKYIDKYEIIHICGPKNFKELNILTKGILREKQRKFYHLCSYLDEEKLGNAYAAADLVISRAGGGAIFEIAASGNPSIVIPLKGGAQNHQAKNAHYFAKTGAAGVIEETNVTPNFVFGRASQIIENKKIYQQMKEVCRKFAKPDAAKKIAEIIIETA